ncbi:Golgi CORVET complex core vacuolar protein 8-domain-containing protein [Scleroderma citrinum]
MNEADLSPSISVQPTARAPQSFVHPTVSRLRSALLQGPAQSLSFSHDSLTPAGAHSPLSYASNISRVSTPLHHDGILDSDQTASKEAFKWTSLQSVSSQVFDKRPSKAALLLGASNIGSPTVLAANGLICVGTDTARIFVFDFKQTLLCICGSDPSASTAGPISSLALSHDYTYVVSGHFSGYVHLYNLKNPQVPTRIVAPASPQLVLSGRQEGHFTGSRIVSVCFVAGRHTGIVTADEHGLAFYHNLSKVLFVEASDTIRILGNYPDEQSVAGPEFRSFRRRRTRNTVLAQATLPLGTAPHPTDAYQLVALLTPSKLVIVGLRPTPKTWLKRLREDPPDATPSDRRRGALAWFPSTKLEPATKDAIGEPTAPTIAYSLGKVIRLIRVSETKVKQLVPNSRTGKMRGIEVGTLVFEDCGTWRMDDIVLALQWLNVNQLTVFTATSLVVYDIRTTKIVEHVTFDPSVLLSPTTSTSNGSASYLEPVGNVAHSVMTYRGKIFLLERERLQVGTLLTWADKILALVEVGDFLKAIELTRTYYTGEAPGNRNGLPDDANERSSVLAKKLLELMVASTRYAFSEDRMTDGTHASPDGRGVDRTSVFEGLVATCARACIALSNYDFLFEDLFQYFDDSGISRIYLEQLEAFVLEGIIRSVPPRITQRLVALHDDDGRPDLAERVIWHIDPTCLDIHQAIRICQAHQLWDALIYVYTRALRDYVSPIVELLSLIRKTLRQPASLTNGTSSHSNYAYKIFPYLINISSAQAFPSGDPLDAEEAHQAMKDIYNFIFSGRSVIWPAQGGSLILTSDSGEVEATYPYARLLLSFDTESFLHCLDIAFESSFFSDESHDISRLWIVTILLDVISDSDLSPINVTFVNIFLARNIPKYPQYVMQPPSVLQNILITLATSMDASTKEDRQLAAESLLSSYTPHDSVLIMRLFEDAGFFRILQHWHRQERRWTHLLGAYLQDPGLESVEMFRCVDEVISLSKRDNRGKLSEDIMQTLSSVLGSLLQRNLGLTAILIDKIAPALHQVALKIIDPADDESRYEYLTHLLDPWPQVDGDENVLHYHPEPSRVDKTLLQLFISLRCRYMPSGLIDTLDRMRSNVDWDAVEQACEENRVYGTVLWAMNQRGMAQEALAKAEAFEMQLSRGIVKALAVPDADPTDISRQLDSLLEIGRRGAAICLEQSSTSANVPLEDFWFQLLRSQLHSIHIISTFQVSGLDDAQRLAKYDALSMLRSRVQETFASFVAISSKQALSFPRLFKRLVDPGLYTGSSSGTPYTEFRTILTGMLESYRTDEDMLVISQHLLGRDVFDTMEEYITEKVKGWSARDVVCTSCHKPLWQPDAVVDGGNSEDTRVIISRAAVYHSRCSP